MNISLITLFTLLTLPQAFAAGENARPLDTSAALEEAESQVGIVQESNNGVDLDKLIESDPALKSHREACIKQISDPSNNYKKSIGDCIWEDMLANDQAKKDEILEKLSAGEKSAQYDGLNINNLKVGSGNEESSAMKKLQNYMAKRLSDALLHSKGKGANGKESRLRNMRHERFYNLYETQLGKNIVSAVSSYCIEADSANGFMIDQGVKRTNISKLKEITNGKSAAYGSWEKCFGSIPKICWGKKVGNYDFDSKETLCDTASSAPYSDTQKCKKRYDETKKRACEVNAYIRSARQAILKVSDIQDKIKERASEDKGKPSFYQGDGIEFDIDKATTLTSKEFAKDSGFKESNDAVVKKLEECEQSDSEDCHKYIDKDPDKTENALAEYSLRTRAMQAKLEKDLGETGADVNKESLKKYLAEEGYSEEEIEKKLSYSDQDLKSLRDEIKKRYKSEREQLVARLNQKISGRVVKPQNQNGQSSDPTTLNGKATNKAVYQSISTELAEKTNEFTQLIHFNNVVSGFLTVKDSSGKEGTNTKALMAELEGSFYEGGGNAGRGVATGTTSGPDAAQIQDFQQLKENIQAAGIKNSGNGEQNDGLSLGVDNINNSPFQYDADRRNAPPPQ